LPWGVPNRFMPEFWPSSGQALTQVLQSYKKTLQFTVAKGGLAAHDGRMPEAALFQYSAAEKRHRVFSIMAASSGNLVEWFDFYVYAFCAVYFAPSFFPKSDPTAQLLNTAGIFAAPDWWQAVWPYRRPQRPQKLDGDLGGADVRRLADDCLPAHLRQHWRLGTRLAAAGAAAAGLVGGRGIRHHGHLHE
jgi:hypothetical protein